MRVLIACEKSGVVRRAFRARGHDAWSCDILPAEDGSKHHLTGDVLTFLDLDWDLMIAHPECTYLTVSAAWAFKDPPYHQKCKPGTLTGAARRTARDEALAFARALWTCRIPKIGMENPVGNLSTLLAPPTQIIQPYEFGDDASKKTCLWLKGLPKLIIDPAKRFHGRMVIDPRTGKLVERFSNQTDGGQNKLPPGDDRSAKRAETYPGIAEAMAEQWSRKTRSTTLFE